MGNYIYPKAVVIKACLLKTGYDISNLRVGTMCHQIYARALRNFCNLKPKEIAKILKCKKDDINRELIISIVNNSEESEIRTQLMLIEAKAHELSWSDKPSLR